MRWQLAFAACFFWLLFASSGAATTVSWTELLSVDGSMPEALSMTDTHKMHKMDSASSPCQKRDCKRSFECGISCVVGGGCACPGVACLPYLTAEMFSSQSERLPAAGPSAFVSRQTDSVFRPPIQ